MAACGSIKHIFEKPLSEAPSFREVLSPWKHIRSMKPIDDPSFTEIFGELYFKENHHHHHQQQPAAVEIPAVVDQEIEKGRHSPSSSERKNHQYRRSESLSSDSLSLCTEGLGSESFELKEWGEHQNIPRNLQAAESHRSEARTSRRGEFPPPISSIGLRRGRPWVWLKSYREDGRFILKEIRIPTQEILHACRHDGRLMLHFMHSDNDELLLQQEQGDAEEQITEEDEDEDEDEEEKRDLQNSLEQCI